MLTLRLLAPLLLAAAASCRAALPTRSGDPPSTLTSSLPYLIPDITGFTPTEGKYVVKDGDDAAKTCAWLGANFPKLVKGYTVDPGTSFGQYFPAGANPSLELLTDLYPAGIISSAVKAELPRILSLVGPDVDLARDHAYGKMSARLASHRPLGGLPPFCRYGGVVKTSLLTETLFEVWLPVEMVPGTKLAPFNQSDFPTNSTPVYLDKSGALAQLPSNFYPKKKKKKSKWTSSSEDETQTPLTSTTKRGPAAAGGMVKRVVKTSRNMDLDDGDECLGGDEILGDGDGWNGRKVHINNGGQRGFVPLPDLKQLMARYRFVVSGSNAGHFSNTSAVDWATGPQREETIADWSHRSQYVTTLLAQQIIDIFYGPESGVRVNELDTKKEARVDSGESKSVDQPKLASRAGPAAMGSTSRVRSYLLGVSVGGGSALSALQVYGAQWDAALVGAPALPFSDTNFAQLQLAQTHRKESVGAAAVFKATIFGDQFHRAVLEQCDELDGLKDGLITEPWKCKLDFVKAIQCGGGGPCSEDEELCLSEIQVANLKKIFSPFKYDNKEFYPGWPIGSEASARRYGNSATKAIDWIRLAVQGRLRRDDDFAYSNGSDGGGFRFEDVEDARQLNIGNSNFALTDLSSFLSGGGKIMHYHGLADLVINPIPTIQYFDDVLKDPKNGGAERVKEQYKLFAIPGMDHGRDGKGAAWHFGGPTQNDAGNRPLRYDTKHDMVLSLVAWTEKGVVPEYQIGAGYEGHDIIVPVSGEKKDTDLIPTRFESWDLGVALTRKHCPWPQMARHVSGDGRGALAWKGFRCE